MHLTRNTEVDTADSIFQIRKLRKVYFARDDIVSEMTTMMFYVLRWHSGGLDCLEEWGTMEGEMVRSESKKSGVKGGQFKRLLVLCSDTEGLSS